MCLCRDLVILFSPAASLGPLPFIASFLRSVLPFAQAVASEAWGPASEVCLSVAALHGASSGFLSCVLIAHLTTSFES